MLLRVHEMKNLFRYMTYTGFTKNNVKRDLSCIVEKCSAFPMIRSKNKLRSEYISVDIAYGSEKHYKQKTNCYFTTKKYLVYTMSFFNGNKNERNKHTHANECYCCCNIYLRKANLINMLNIAQENESLSIKLKT